MNRKNGLWVFIIAYAVLTGAKLLWLNIAQKENPGMKADEAQDYPMKTIPPIDAAAPAEFETATFAMG